MVTMNFLTLLKMVMINILTLLPKQMVTTYYPGLVDVSGSLLSRIVITFIQYYAKQHSKLNGIYNMKIIISSLYLFFVVFLLNTEKAVRIKQLTDVDTIVLQKLNYAG